MSILSAEAVNWLANGERGTSSNTMFERFTGIDCTKNYFGGSHPRDPDDFRRCELLLRQVPEFRECLPTMADMSAAWSQLVDHWGEIVALMEEECPGVFSGKHGAARRTYELMKPLGC